ncbi:MAG: flagellar assembly protein T N-terminal domain-containing protein [Proteobacteria bacterium]|uniref:Flagellar assembly protein T N-terminal domain-containing protein n=1 Tax=Candidatus Avisuccinivibrio stercorigallinarum TaxID=2840704 RepID=A0A9D9DE46_9GAMM|nr:flagellar assembly protein T N-terminal domain-containing protein [Candidatus Avisuccinivibrio stercorigallinarum]
MKVAGRLISALKTGAAAAAVMLAVVPAAQAQWYTADGRAAILYDDVEKARTEAINDALRSIMLEAGADINVSADYQGGALLNESFNIKSSSPVRKMTILEEQRTLSSVTVKVRAYVDEDRTMKCAQSSVRKSILPLIFRFADDRAYQSAVGLDDLPREIERNLLLDLGSTASIRLLPQASFRFFADEYSSGPSYAEIKALEEIAAHYRTQFLLVGTLRSAALSESGDNVFERLLYKPTRTLDFDLALYNTLSGRLLIKKNYRAESDWDFKQGQYLDLRSEQFLSSAYGQRLTELCSYAADDIVNALTCLPSAARIIEVNGDEILISLGSNDGLKEGLKFNLSHQSESYDRQQRAYSRYDRSESAYRVEAVFPETARLVPVSLNHSPLNVMIDDVVVLR